MDIMYRGNFNDDRNFDRFLFSPRRNSEIVNLDNRTLKSHRSRNITLFKFSFTRPPRERANKPANLETTLTLVDSKTERNKTEWTDTKKKNEKDDDKPFPKAVVRIGGRSESNKGPTTRKLRSWFGCEERGALVVCEIGRGLPWRLARFSTRGPST